MDIENTGPTSHNKETPTGYISIWPGKEISMSGKVTERLSIIQQTLSMPLWRIVHDGEQKFGMLDEEVWNGFFKAQADLKKDEPIALLISSPGGDADVAYKIAKLIRRICGHFVALIPIQAKSAATLLTLGAKQIYLGKDAELGPLDVQIMDYNEEKSYSALDEVQSLDGLFEFATNQIIDTTVSWSRTFRRKRIAIFPSAIEYVVLMMKPLMDKIDTVHYMYLSRTLNIAKEYAFRLLLDNFKVSEAKLISKHLVEKYPNHGFIIDYNEAKNIGLTNVIEISDDLQLICNELFDTLEIEEVPFCLVGKFIHYESSN